ncbi:response regulator transcription factor [Variovorax paradoxus]|nr:response regulator transcription factor [Variovorax paradoxus]
MRIAALDGEPRQLELIRHALAVIGHECHAYEDGRSLQCALYQQSFDMLILDWRPPDVEGSDVVRWIRQQLGSRLPILFAAKRHKEEDMVEALTLGADDFMAKPIRVAELQARVQALLRRAYPALFETELVCGPYRFIPLQGALQIHGQAAKLKHREYTLAIFLFRNIGRLLSREHLLEAVWGADAALRSRSLDTHMSRLRSKLDLRPANGLALSAVYGLGYRLEFIDNNGVESPYPTADAAQ